MRFTDLKIVKSPFSSFIAVFFGGGVSISIRSVSSRLKIKRFIIIQSLRRYEEIKIIIVTLSLSVTESYFLLGILTHLIVRMNFI